MPTETVKLFIRRKGTASSDRYGGKDIFFHISTIQTAGSGRYIKARK